MVENSGRNRRLLAGVVGVNLALALAVSAGAVPKLDDERTVRTAAVSQVEEVAAHSVRQPGDTEAALTQATSPTTTVAAAAVTVAAAAPTTSVAPKPTTPPTTKAPAASPVATTKPAAAVAAVAPVTAPVAAAAKVARRTPSAAEVQTGIAGLKSRVGGLLLLISPTEAQLAQAGDQVCTAFDSGQTFAQVKATGLSMIPASITVTPPTVDWAVRQGVAMYCPGHASKLV